MFILPPRKDPFLIQLEALLPRLSTQHPHYHSFDQQLRRELSGFLGEKSLRYYLEIIDDPDALVLFGTRLLSDRSYFQIDCLYFTPRFATIIEVKNHRGEISFNQAGQMIQTFKHQTNSYGHPIIQANEQRLKLKKLLHQLGIDNFPIEMLVTFTNQNAILNLDKPCKIRITSEQLPERLRYLSKKHSTQLLSKAKLKNLTLQLKQLHTPRQASILQKYKVNRSMITRGVDCPACGRFGMTRHLQKWYCQSCKLFDRTAHIRALADYALIHGPLITNSQARSYLKVSSRHVINRLLKSEAISRTNTTNRTKYDLSKLIEKTTDDSGIDSKNWRANSIHFN